MPLPPPGPPNPPPNSPPPALIADSIATSPWLSSANGRPPLQVIATPGLMLMLVNEKTATAGAGDACVNSTPLNVGPPEIEIVGGESVVLMVIAPLVTFSAPCEVK